MRGFSTRNFCRVCSSLLPDLCDRGGRTNVYVYIYTCLYIYIHIHTCICIYMYASSGLDNYQYHVEVCLRCDATAILGIWDHTADNLQRPPQGPWDEASWDRLWAPSDIASYDLKDPESGLSIFGDVLRAEYGLSMEYTSNDIGISYGWRYIPQFIHLGPLRRSLPI